MIKFHSLNGTLVSEESAKIHVTDLGLLRGFGIFDFFTVSEGKPVFMKEHLLRFYKSAAQMQMSIHFTPKELSGKIMELIQANGMGTAAIRLLLTGGFASDGFTPSTPNLLILQHEFKAPDPELYQTGCKLITFEHVRTLPEIKTTSYFIPILLINKMKTSDAVDVLYHDVNGWISETSRSNFFIISKAGKLVTANKNILKGVTRMHTLELAQRLIEVEERDLNMEELHEAREAFITSTTKGILPIVQIGTQLIGNGKPGEVTMRLRSLLLNYKSNSPDLQSELSLPAG